MHRPLPTDTCTYTAVLTFNTEYWLYQVHMIVQWQISTCLIITYHHRMIPIAAIIMLKNQCNSSRCMIVYVYMHERLTLYTILSHSLSCVVFSQSIMWLECGFLFLNLNHEMMNVDELSADRQSFEWLLRENLLEAMVVLYQLSKSSLHSATRKWKRVWTMNRTQNNNSK